MLTSSELPVKLVLRSVSCLSWCRMSCFIRSLASFRPQYNYGLQGKGKSGTNLPPSVSSVPATRGEVLFGLHPILLALQANKRKLYHQIFVDSKFQSRDKRDSEMEQVFECASQVPIQFVSRNVLDHLAGNRPHQGVCMDVEKLEVPEWNHQHTLTQHKDGHKLQTKTVPVWLLLHNVQDPMNFGAILRTSHYLGVDQVVFPSNNSCKLSPVVSKASAGALEIINMVKLPEATSEVEFCEWWQSQGGYVVGTGSHMSENNRLVLIEDFNVPGPTLMLLGNENSGLGKELEDCCDQILTIPGHEAGDVAGRVDSLNVSVAAGILIHWIKTAASKTQPS